MYNQLNTIRNQAAADDAKAEIKEKQAKSLKKLMRDIPDINSGYDDEIRTYPSSQERLMNELKDYKLNDIFANMKGLTPQMKHLVSSRLKLNEEGMFERYNTDGIYESTIFDNKEIVDLVNETARSLNSPTRITGGGDFSAEKLDELARFGSKTELERFVYNAEQKGITLDVNPGTLVNATEENYEYLRNQIFSNTEKRKSDNSSDIAKMSDEEYEEFRKTLGFRG